MQQWHKPSRLQLALALLLGLMAALCRAEDNIILLVATPDLEGSVFEQSVILVAPHDNGAAMGVILNQPLPFDPDEIYPGDELLSEAGVIHFGGPVNPQALLFLFRSRDIPENAVHLFDDVYFSGNRDLLARQLQRPREESALQFYIGYSGWAIGQLQAEVRRGSWSIVKATPAHLFDSDRKTLWQVLSGHARDKWI